MLKFEDNPELFSIIWQQNAEKFRGFRGFFTPKQGDYLTDEELEQITSLKILRTTDFDKPIKTLDGIEKLVNLKEFEFVGFVGQNMFSSIRGTLDRSNYLGDEATERDRQYILKIVKNSQLEDISALSKCSKLESVIIRNQNIIKEIDFSNMPLLHHIELTKCRALRTVNGLNELLVIKNPDEAEKIFEKDPYLDIVINFNDCYALRDIGKFDEFVSEWYQNDQIPVDTKISLPTTAYCNLTRVCPEGIKNLLQHHKEGYDFVNWTDVGAGSVLYSINTGQIQLAKDRVDNIIRTVCEDNDTGIVKVAKVYRWICDNVVYDKEQYIKEQSGNDNVNWEHYSGHENIFDRNKTRSMYRALFDKKAVCVGISHLFNFMCSDIGFLALPCSCSATYSGDSRLAISNHQISKMFINNGAYYFDPTWDLNTTKSSFFALSKQEMEQKGHTFTIDDEFEQETDSIQAKLNNAKLLFTQTKVEPQETVVR